MCRTTSLILGGGPAGSAAAITLANSGEKPLLIERNRETGDALCGGFLSWRSLETLERLGLSAAALAGHPIESVRLFSENARGEARLPHRAIGVSRHRLDGMLLALAETRGAMVERGIAARLAAPSYAELTDGAGITCESLFLATGKHDCRGLARPRVAVDPALGLRLRITASRQLTALVGPAIELHLFRGGYAGLLLQEDGSGNLCMAVQKSRLAEADGDPSALLAALGRESLHLGERISLAGPGAAIDAIGAVPYGWRAHDGTPGLFRLGDQAMVIASLAGEGMGIALASGVMAARRYLAGGAAAATAFQPELARRTHMAMLLAGSLRDAVAGRGGRRIAPHVLRTFPALGAALARLTRIAA